MYPGKSDELARLSVGATRGESLDSAPGHQTQTRMKSRFHAGFVILGPIAILESVYKLIAQADRPLTPVQTMLRGTAVYDQRWTRLRRRPSDSMRIHI